LLDIVVEGRILEYMSQILDIRCDLDSIASLQALVKATMNILVA